LRVLFLADADMPKADEKQVCPCRAEQHAVRRADQGNDWKAAGAKPDGAVEMQSMD
jgi:hypothetical protein